MQRRGPRRCSPTGSTSQVGDDPELLAKVIPDYPATGKRTLQDNGSWLRALTRDNVELVRDGIERIEPDAVVTADGRRHPVDVIVYATGFQANRFLWPMEIVGRDGAVLAEQWGDEPTAYLGITVPNFPNLFCLYGPGTNLASGGSLIFHSECQMRYISGCLHELLAGGHTRDGAAARRARRLPGPAARPRWSRWCGPTRRSSTPGTRTTTAASTSCRRGGWWTTGTGPAGPIPRTSS